jgi:uncharacterized membrane protein
MSWVQWMAWFFLFMFYITCLFTVCSLTFRKGYTVLGIIGIFIPFIWLICAILPAKPGSRYEVEQQSAQRLQMQQYSQ